MTHRISTARPSMYSRHKEEHSERLCMEWGFMLRGWGLRWRGSSVSWGTSQKLRNHFVTQVPTSSPQKIWKSGRRVREHCWNIEPRNREKSLALIWQRFSCLLDEWIAKISKFFFFMVAFWDNPHCPFWDAHGQLDKSENIFGIWY